MADSHLRPLDHYLQLTKMYEQAHVEERRFITNYRAQIIPSVIETISYDVGMFFNSLYRLDIDTEFSIEKVPPYVLKVKKSNPNETEKIEFGYDPTPEELDQIKLDAEKEGYEVEKFNGSEENEGKVFILDTISEPYEFLTTVGHEMLHRYARESGMYNYFSPNKEANMIHENLADLIGMHFALGVQDEYVNDPIVDQISQGHKKFMSNVKIERLITLAVNKAIEKGDSEEIQRTLKEANEIADTDITLIELQNNRNYACDWEIFGGLKQIEQKAHYYKTGIDLCGHLATQNEVQETISRMNHDIKRERKTYDIALKGCLERILKDPQNIESARVEMLEMYVQAHNIIKYQVPGIKEPIEHMLHEYQKKINTKMPDQTENDEYRVDTALSDFEVNFKEGWDKQERIRELAKERKADKNSHLALALGNKEIRKKVKQTKKKIKPS